jgi:hypothetical protein
MPDEAVLEKSATSESSNTQGKECSVGEFITEADGWKIIAVAATWEGTEYKAIGAGSQKGVKGDCSGTTNKIFVEAGFPYPYQPTFAFTEYAAKSHRFREVDPKKTPMQAGDVLLWPGHMAIYAPFPEGHPKRDTGVMKNGRKMFNDMYTAFNDRRYAPYAPYNISVFRPDHYKVFRYLKLPCP